MNMSLVLLIGIALAFLGVACTRNEPRPSPTASVRCPPLPAAFKESDLIGTWVAKYRGTDATDTLIVREDGTYKQTYNEPLSGYHFESDWQRWSVERRASGLLRLHLKGMRRCDDVSSLCLREGGGLGGPYPIRYYAIDYCEEEGMEMPDEIILVATGVLEREAPFIPRGIKLRHMRLPGSEWTYSFELQK